MSATSGLISLAVGKKYTFVGTGNVKWIVKRLEKEKYSVVSCSGGDTYLGSFEQISEDITHAFTYGRLPAPNGPMST